MDAASPDRIVLVGFMGSGKTTVGAELARALGWSFLDMDSRIEERAGVSVAAIFATQGEAAFRAEERRLADEIAGLGRHVVAAGGGAFAQPDTRDRLREGAVTVWLDCDFETVLQRVGSGEGRPLASNRATMRKMFGERQSAYRLADLKVDASPDPAEVARRIVRALEVRGARSRARGG
jgi:shikimate kinase